MVHSSSKVPSAANMSDIHEADVARIRRRIRIRVVNWPLRMFTLFLLFLLVGIDNSSSIMTLASASELNDDEFTSSKAGSLDVKMTASLIKKSKEKEKPRIQTRNLEEENITMNRILIKAGKRGLSGGLPGAVAGVVQVVSLMWLRTIINYQSRYGASFMQALTALMNDGGIPRFYRGLSFALIQAPLSRFVSTAANDGVEFFLGSVRPQWGPGRTTVVAGFVVGLWRMILMPIDTCKTVLQVDSVEGFRNLMRRVKAGKIGVLYQGAIANALSSFVSHYPWFYTYNVLSKSEVLKSWIPNQLVRNAGTGLFASIVADTVVNAIRVVKTTKQAIGSKHNVGYGETIRMILAADGWKGLFGRGLRTRIFANALQSIVFTLIWRGLAERWQMPVKDDDDSDTQSEQDSE